MADKRCFEAVDRSLRPIMKSVADECSSKLFGGITTVLCGDFRQILPVIPKGDGEDAIEASIKTSYLWDIREVHSLKQNMRLKSRNMNSSTTMEKESFAQWILDNDLMIHSSSDGVRAIVRSTYADLLDHIGDSNYRQAILAHKNETVEQINDYIMGMQRGEEKTYLSSDTICKADFQLEDEDLLYPAEFLNTFSRISKPCTETKNGCSGDAS
ncbi:uncharacterized protein LOC116206341 [Punica granatum]|nr:uncharacterized protein LOC116206341 [Punica granatum]